MLPVEIIEKIITELWFFHLSRDDRITLMLSSTLVNKTWSNMFTCISFKDVYIPSPAYLQRFLRLTHIETLYTSTRPYRELLCRSISLTIENTSVHPPWPPDYGRPLFTPNSGAPPMAQVLYQLVFTLSSYHSGFPNLRTISIEFINMGFHDVLIHYCFFRFPKQVTDLELAFSFSPRTPPWLLNGLRLKQARWGCLSACMPSVRRLTILGASDAFLADMVKMCKNLDTLQLDFPVGPAVRRWESRVIKLSAGMETNADSEEHGDGTPSSKSLPRLIIIGISGLEDVWEGEHVESASGIYDFHRPRVIYPAPTLVHAP
jgi:hypothetical protein